MILRELERPNALLSACGRDGAHQRVDGEVAAHERTRVCTACEETSGKAGGAPSQQEDEESDSERVDDDRLAAPAAPLCRLLSPRRWAVLALPSPV